MTSKKLIIESCTKYIQSLKQALLEQFCEDEDDQVAHEVVHKLTLFFETYPPFEENTKTNESKKPKVKKIPKSQINIKDANKLENDFKETEIWLHNVSGINYYIDNENNAYSVEDFMFYMEQFTTTKEEGVGEEEDEEANKIQLKPLKRFGKLVVNESDSSSRIVTL